MRNSRHATNPDSHAFCIEDGVIIRLYYNGKTYMQGRWVIDIDVGTITRGANDLHLPTALDAIAEWGRRKRKTDGA